MNHTTFDHHIYFNVHRIFTGCNEVVAKVMFLHVSVILLTGGTCLRQTPCPPPKAESPPWSRHPPEADPPRNRHPREHTSLEHTPPRSRHPLQMLAPAHDLQAAGTHPTGMHSGLACGHSS